MSRISLLLALLVAAVAAAVPTGAPAASSNPAGVALHHRVQAAYTHIPAVQIIETAGSRPVSGVTLRFTDALEAGKIIAERLIEVFPAGSETVVRRLGSGTFVRNPKASCWRRLGSSNPQALTDVGSRFLSLKGLRVAAPQKTRDGWSLVESAGNRSFTLYITRALLVREIAGTSGGQHFAERLTALQSAPRLPVPRPLC